MSASFVGSLVASAALCAVLAVRVDVGTPPLDAEASRWSDEVEMNSAWANEVWLEGAVQHEPCNVDELKWRYTALMLAAAVEAGAADEQRRERSRLSSELKRCGAWPGEDPQCAPGSDGVCLPPEPAGTCG